MGTAWGRPLVAAARGGSGGAGTGAATQTGERGCRWRRLTLRVLAMASGAVEKAVGLMAGGVRLAEPRRACGRVERSATRNSKHCRRRWRVQEAEPMIGEPEMGAGLGCLKQVRPRLPGVHLSHPPPAGRWSQSPTARHTNTSCPPSYASSRALPTRPALVAALASFIHSVCGLLAGSTQVRRDPFQPQPCGPAFGRLIAPGCRVQVPAGARRPAGRPQRPRRRSGAVCRRPARRHPLKRALKRGRPASHPAPAGLPT